MNRALQSLIAILVSLSISQIFPAGLASAATGMISTSELVDQLSREQAKAVINQQLDRADVQEQLVALGVDPLEAQERLASLSDSEMSQIATQMEEAQYGGITSILIVVVLVLLIIYLAKKI